MSNSEDKIWSPRSSQSKYLKTGNEPFRVRDKTVGFTISDYWRWAHSDLLDNAARGVLAEFLVVRALDYTLALDYTYEPRHEWDAIDIRTESGLKVEVKSAAYAQSWPQCKPSTISFDIASRSREWNAKTDEYETCKPPKRVADVYVFCLLGRLNDPEPDPMDVDQWEFYVLATKTLNQEYPCQKTIGLNSLKSLVQGTTRGGTTPYCELAQDIETEGKHT